MPISVIFTYPVKQSARKQIEKHLDLTTSVPVTGAWHWFSDRRVDFRPKDYWKPGTTVSMVADLDHVGDGYGRYGTHSYTRDFTIGADVRTHVYVKTHKTVVTRDGKVLRTMSSDAGSPDFPSWDGTMAVVNKSPTVRMTSCSVKIACDKDDPNFYDLVLPWDVRITWSGTFLHYSTGDPHPGHSYGSHGCVHLSWDDAKWYYDLMKQGDPVTITGSPRGKADGDNGYAAYNLSWNAWLAEPAAWADSRPRPEDLSSACQRNRPVLEGRRTIHYVVSSSEPQGARHDRGDDQRRSELGEGGRGVAAGAHHHQVRLVAERVDEGERDAGGDDGEKGDGADVHLGGDADGDGREDRRRRRVRHQVGHQRRRQCQHDDDRAGRCRGQVPDPAAITAGQPAGHHDRAQADRSRRG